MALGWSLGRSENDRWGFQCEVVAVNPRSCGGSSELYGWQAMSQQIFDAKCPGVFAEGEDLGGRKTEI